MPVKLYAAVAGLTAKEMAVLDFLSEPDEDFLEMIEALAQLWRTRLRACGPDPAWCRRMMLVRTALLASQHKVTAGQNRLLVFVIALAITDRVEERVVELDKEEVACGCS